MFWKDYERTKTDLFFEVFEEQEVHCIRDGSQEVVTYPYIKFKFSFCMLL